MRPQHVTFSVLILVLMAALGAAARADQISGYVLHQGDLAPIVRAKATCQALPRPPSTPRTDNPTRC